MVCTIVLARFSLTFISTFLSKSLFCRAACNCLAFKDTFKRSFFVNFGNTTKVLVTALLHIFFVLLALIPPNHTKLSISQLLYQINIKCCFLKQDCFARQFGILLILLIIQTFYYYGVVSIFVSLID